MQEAALQRKLLGYSLLAIVGMLLAVNMPQAFEARKLATPEVPTPFDVLAPDSEPSVKHNRALRLELAAITRGGGLDRAVITTESEKRVCDIELAGNVAIADNDYRLGVDIALFRVVCTELALLYLLAQWGHFNASNSPVPTPQRRKIALRVFAAATVCNVILLAYQSANCTYAYRLREEKARVAFRNCTTNVDARHATALKLVELQYEHATAEFPAAAVECLAKATRDRDYALALAATARQGGEQVCGNNSEFATLVSRTDYDDSLFLYLVRAAAVEVCILAAFYFSRRAQFLVGYPSPFKLRPESLVITLALYATVLNILFLGYCTATARNERRYCEQMRENSLTHCLQRANIYYDSAVTAANRQHGIAVAACPPAVVPNPTAP